MYYFWIKENPIMATISFSTKFNLTLSPKQFVFIDTSDYAGQGITTSDVNGCFTIIAPSGVTVYSNTDFSNGACDIRIASSTTDQQVIPLPIGTDGLVEAGTYTIIYNVYNSNLTETYTVTNSINYDYVSPELDIDISVNVISPIFSQTDDTNYVVNGVTPTLIRENKLVYPAGIEGGAPSPIITSNKILKTSVVYNGPQTSILTSDLTYVFSTYTVIDQLFKSKYTTVDGSYYCSIACGLKNFEKKISGCRDTELKKQYKEQFKLAMSYVALIRLLIECNGGTGIDSYLLKIHDIIGECDCGCDEETENFSRITGWGTLVGADGTDGTDGADGTNGTDGEDGVGLLFNNTTVDSPTDGNGSLQTLGTKSYVLPAGVLTSNGDAIEATTYISAAGTNAAHIGAVLLNGTNLISNSATGLSNPVHAIRVTITRMSSTTVLAQSDAIMVSATGAVSFQRSNIKVSSAVNNLDSLTNTLSVRGSSASGTTMQSSFLMVKLYKI